MQREVINPWSWQDQYGFVQANALRGPQRMLICAGQAAVDAEGRPVHPGDMRAQLTQALDNLETVLRAAGFTFADVMRLTTYTTDVDALLGCYDVLVSRQKAGGCKPAATLVGVARLAFPELLVEIEATAVA
jgi:enamine deaminase RidA (YjgF/YER057c/UK114 family)